MTGKNVHRRLAAIAIADVAGFSRLMGIDEAGTLAALSERRKRILEPVVRAHDGRIVKVMGDGVLLEFASTVNAVEAAIELQEQMAAANAGLAEDRRIILRIGINLGEIIVEGSDVFGNGVNIAARLEGIAPVGGIVISGGAYDQVKNIIALAVEDLGDQALKNIAEPVRVYRIGNGHAPAASAATPATAVAKATERPSIAILPFTNLGADAAQGFFSDGITEDIITELSRWRLLSVRSRSASFRYRGAAVDMRQVARELDVRFILEGSVRRMGERIRVSAQLIDAETGSHVWAEKFDRDAAEIFNVQDQLVRTIVSTLVGRVRVSDAERARRKPPASLAAYECVLKGNALSWNDPEGAAEASRLFEQAIAIDAGYALAHAMLCAMRCQQWYDDPGDSDAALQEAHALATRAVELDENESSCFAMLGWVHLLRRSFDLALQCGRRAIEINPTNQWNTADLGSTLVYLGEADEALEWFRRAKEIDPYFDLPWYWRAIGQAYMMLHRYEEALAKFDSLPARQYRIAALAAGCHARLGQMEQARQRAAICLAMKPEFTISHFMTKEPFKHPRHAAEQAESLRLAGLPE